MDGSQAFGYDVAADGRRFVVVRTITRPERHAVVVENWLARWGRESKVALAHAVLRRGSALMAQDQALQRLAARLGSKGRAMRPAVAHAGGVANQLVVDGRLVGTWARRFHARTAVIEVRTSRPLTRAEKHALFVECERYGRFVDMPVRLSVA